MVFLFLERATIQLIGLVQCSAVFALVLEVHILGDTRFRGCSSSSFFYDNETGYVWVMPIRTEFYGYSRDDLVRVTMTGSQVGSLSPLLSLCID